MMDPVPAKKIGAILARELSDQPTTEQDQGEAMTNPFEDEKGIYHVLIGQRGASIKLWQTGVQGGAAARLDHRQEIPDTRAACLPGVHRPEAGEDVRIATS